MPWTVKRQFLLAVTATVVLGGLIIGESARFLEARYLNKELARQNERVSAIISAMAIEAVISEDRPILDTIVREAARTDPAILTLGIENDAGKVLARWSSPHAPGVRGVKKHSHQDDGTLSADDITHFSRDIIFEGESFGAINILWDLAHLRTGIAERTKLFRWLTGIVFIVFGGVFLLWVQRLVLSPIGRIHAKVETLNQGKVSGDELKLNAAREFTSLAQAVNKLGTTLDSLQQSEQRFSDLIESLPLGLLIHEKWKPLFVNQTYADMLGYQSPDEILALPSRENQIAPYDRARMRGYQTARLSGQAAPPNYEYDAVRRDGSIITLHNVAHCIEWDGSTKIINMILDVTEQKRAQKEIERLNHRNRLILNSVGEGIYGVDLEGRATFVNPAAAEMLGWVPEELIGKDQHTIIHQSKADSSPYPREACPICGALKDGVLRRSETELFWRKNGTSIPVEFVSTPIRENDEMVGAVVTFRDISNRQELEGQLQQAQKLESIGQLAAGIAHEINTPTQFIGDNTRFLQESFAELATFTEKSAELVKAAETGEMSEELIKDTRAVMEGVDLEYLNEEIPNAIDQTLEGIERVAKIVGAMKDFSHPGSEKTLIDLNRAIETTITVARNEWKYVADMVTDFDSALPLVPCLASEFNQVVLNMIVNAAHAIAEAQGEDPNNKGTITVSTRHVDGWAEVRLSDTGTGIPEQIRSRVFDHFFTTKDVGKGTGQGLSIAHGVIVKKHGGEIELDSEVGKGTTFIVKLPLRDPDQLSAEEAA